MDLPKQLTKRLSLLSLLVLGLMSLVMAISLRTDVARELQAAARTAELIEAVAELSAHPERGPGRLKALLDDGGFRHIGVQWRSGAGSGGAEPSWLIRLLDRVAASGPRPERVIARGSSAGEDWAIVVGPDPTEELLEVLRDFVYVVGVLLLFSVVLLAMTGMVAQRALRPVREILAGLARIEAGDLTTRVPPPELHEYAQIAAAIDRLAESLAAARANERRLGRQLIEIQERERRELAVELHDEFGQSLTAIAANAAYLARQAAGLAGPEAEARRAAAEDIGNESRRILGHVRALLTQLKPHGLEGFTLGATLAELVDAWRQRVQDLAIGFACDDGIDGIGEQQALLLYRGVQEGLTNVIRHARASRCAVSLHRVGAELVLGIEDDGIGRVAQAATADGAGLLGLRERAAMAGGRLELQDVAPRGWRLLIRLPVAAGAAA